MQESTSTTCGRPCAGSWGEHAAYVDARAERLTSAMLERSAPRPGRPRARVGLRSRWPRVGGGAGRRPRRPRRAVRRRGGDDVDRGGACRVARARQREHPRARPRPIDQPDASYDVALCREGLMFALDPAGAVARDRARPAAGRAVRDRGLGTTRTQSVAGKRAGRGERRSSACRFLLRAFPDRSRSTTRTRSPPCSSATGSRRSSSARCPPACRSVRSRSGGHARGRWPDPSRRCSQRCLTTHVQRDPPRAEAAVGAYKTPSGLEFPGVSLLASGRRAG